MSIREDKDLAEWIDDHGDGLTSWETEFLDKMLKRLDMGAPLSPGQRRKLQQIYVDRCAEEVP